ncbi:MAG: serine--tRNA ligase [Acidimicrobiales bacterium]
MIDIRLVREDCDGVKSALARRGIDPSEVDRLVELDRRARAATGTRDELRASVKALSRQVGEARRAGQTEEAQALSERSRALGDEERAAHLLADEARDVVRRTLLYLPNLPAGDAPDGRGPEDNVMTRTWPDSPPSYSASQRVPHWETGIALGLLDMERGAKLSGSMFPLYRGFGARLLRALTAFALDRHAAAFEEIRPPSLVLTDTMVSSGQLPKFEEDAYHLERDDLWAIPTAEVPLTSMWRGDILDESELPLRLTAATACFRRESGAAGRDTRGLLRVHEFDKVELFAYVTPAQAPEVLHELVDRAESLLRELGLQYRVLDLCAGDMGIAAARTFDLEVYAPGVDQWLEVSSVSWCSDYQARRANWRYRPASGRGPVFVHTLNGSALAWARIWAALVETGRRADGSVELPEALAPYLRGETVIPVPQGAVRREER